jgi:hypothetical protein
MLNAVTEPSPCDGTGSQMYDGRGRYVLGGAGVFWEGQVYFGRGRCILGGAGVFGEGQVATCPSHDDRCAIGHYQYWGVRCANEKAVYTCR